MATLTPGEQARMYALGKIMRGGASRGGYVSSQVFIAIDGVHVGFGATPHRVLLDTLTITDELDETPNTCGFRLNGLVPAAGAEVVITLGSKNAGRLYAGFALTVQQLYVGDKPANVQADVRCVDYTWQFGFVLVTRQYRTQSASAIAADLVTTYAAANGFTSTAVVPNLPVLDEITFTDEPLDAALTRIARRIGGYWFVDYQKGVHLFLEDTANAPEPLTPTHKSLRAFQNSADRTQVLTRVYVEGRGSNVLAPVAAGASLLPLEAVDMFAVGPDVFAKVSPQGSEGGAQHLTYTGVTPGGAGSLVGSSATPSAAPTLAAAAGGSVTPGWHSYVYTWVSAQGETPGGPASGLAITTSAPAAVAPAVAVGAGPGLPAGTYTYGVTHVLASGETAVAGNVAAVCTFATAAGTAAPQVVGGSGTTTLGTAGDHVQFRIAYRYVGLSTPATLGPATAYTLVQYAGAAAGTAAGVQVRIWGVTDTGGATCCDIQMQNLTAGGGWRTQLSGVAIPVSPNSVVQPFGNGAFAAAVVETGLGTAAVTVTVNDAGADVTARRVYRTKVNGSQQYLLRQVSGSAQTTFVDTAADSALVTVAPAGTGALQTVNLSGIAVGPKTGSPACTARKIYRSKAAFVDGQCYYLATIADNTTTTFVDTQPDSGLGALVPSTNTSGLTADAGQVLAGATTIPVSGTGAFPPAGGWVLSGNNRVRYTGVTGSALTGVPATGDGSILNTIPYSTPITLAPMLTGIPASGAGAIATPIGAGDEIYLVVQQDDAARQTTVAAMVHGGPGVREEWVQDRRLSIAEARARAQATLQMRPLEDVTITYVCRDLRTASGKTITVNLPAPTNVFGTFKIQSVTINNFRPHPTQYPTYTVTASSRRFNFEDWLRRMDTSV